MHAMTPGQPVVGEHEREHEADADQAGEHRLRQEAAGPGSRDRLLKPTSWISSGSDPNWSTVTSLFIDSTVKLPLIWARPLNWAP